jgi:phytoene desaturase
MGSLAAAIRLGAMGFDVEVFEKNDRLGGRMSRLEDSGFTFDTGPSLLLMTDTYRELFSFAGRDLDDYVRLVPLDGQYRVTFGDGDSLTIHRTLPELINELEHIEPASPHASTASSRTPAASTAASSSSGTSRAPATSSACET